MTQTLIDLIVGAVWLVCVIVCFLKWKTWTAIFGIIAPVLSNIPIGGMYLHHIITEPFIYVGLPAAAIRLAKPVSWWAKWFYWGPMGSDRRPLRLSPKLARALARFPEQTVDFERPGPKSSNNATQKTDTSVPPSNVTTNESPQKQEHLVETMRRTLRGIRDFVNHHLTLRRRTATMNDNVHYDQVAKELQAKEIVPGVWAKAFAKAGGELERARALYIKYRVAQLVEEANEKARQERRAAAEAAKQDREYARKTRAEYTPPPPPRSAPPPTPTKTASSADTPPPPVLQPVPRTAPAAIARLTLGYIAAALLLGVIAILVLVGVIRSIQSDRERLRLGAERQQIVSDDGKIEVTVPSSWTKIPDMNKKATVMLKHEVAVCVGDDSTETYLIVITHPKTEVPNRLGSTITLEEHHQLTRDQRLEEMKNASATSPISLLIDGHPALQDEITGTRKGIDWAFLHTTINEGDYFQEILGSTVKSRWQEQNELLREIASSFRTEK